METCISYELKLSIGLCRYCIYAFRAEFFFAWVGIVQVDTENMIDAETCDVRQLGGEMIGKLPTYNGGRQCVYLDSTEAQYKFGYADCMEQHPFICFERST